MRNQVAASRVASLGLMVLLLSSAILGIANIQQAYAAPTIQYTNTIQLTNSQTTATPAPFEQYITVPLGTLGVSSLLRSDLGNIRFCSDSQCNTMLHAWLESCSSTCGPSVSGINVWIKLPSGIGASSTLTVIFAIYETSQTFDSNFWGEAPQLSFTYGANDNGPSVFTFYDNFHGTSLDITKWNTVTTGNGIYSVNNGLFVDSNGNSNENGVQVYTSQTFNGNYVYETYVGSYNQGTGFGCDCNLGLGFQVTPPSNAFVITMDGYAFWHYGFFNVYFISSPSPCCHEYSSPAGLPPAPFIVSAIWTQGSQILLMDYTQLLSWSDTLVAYSANHFGIFSSSWRGDNSQAVNYARVRAMPPNNVMPSPTVGDLQIVGVEPVQAVFGASALVSGKPTVIKVDVKSTFAVPLTTQVETTYNGNTVTDTITIPANCEKVFYLPVPVTTSQCETSVSAGVPLIPSGNTFDVSVRIDPTDVITPFEASKKVMSASLPVKITVPLTVVFIPVSVTGDPPNDLTQGQLIGIKSVTSELINGMFPVNPGEMNYTIAPGQTISRCFVVIDCSFGYPYLQSIMLVQLSMEAYRANPHDLNLRYVGLVPTGWFSTHGAGTTLGVACPGSVQIINDTIACPSNKAVLAEGAPTGNPDLPFGALSIAHEIGHTYYFTHSFVCTNPADCKYTTATGYWVSRGRTVPLLAQGFSPFAYDLMSKTLDGTQYWITTKHYDSLIDCLKTPEASLSLQGFASPGCIGRSLPDPELLLFSGVYLQNGTMLGGPWYDIPNGIPSLVPGGDGNFTIQFLGRNGSVLSSDNFILSFSPYGAQTKLQAIPFAFAAPFPSATATVVITHQGTVVLKVDPYSKSLHDAIASLPDKAFDKNPDQRRNALLNKIQAFEKMLAQDDINGALHKLQNDIKPHLQEWVVDYHRDNGLQMTKAEILQLIDRLIARLSAQSGTTSSAQTGFGLGRENLGWQPFCTSSCSASLKDASIAMIDYIHGILQIMSSSLRQFGLLVGQRTGLA